MRINHSSNRTSSNFIASQRNSIVSNLIEFLIVQLVVIGRSSSQLCFHIVFNEFGQSSEVLSILLRTHSSINTAQRTISIHNVIIFANIASISVRIRCHNIICCSIYRLSKIRSTNYRTLSNFFRRQRQISELCCSIFAYIDLTSARENRFYI